VSRTHGSFTLKISGFSVQIQVKSGFKKWCQGVEKVRTNIISLPNLSGNIPINQAYGTFYSQVVRIFNANNTSELFITNMKVLIDKLCKQGFNRRILFVYLDGFITNYRFKIINKFWNI
jgi:hypothetical protein